MVEARLHERGQAPVRGEEDDDRHDEATSLTSDERISGRRWASGAPVRRSAPAAGGSAVASCPSDIVH